MKQKKLTRKQALNQENKKRDALRSRSQRLTFDEIRTELNKTLKDLGKAKDAKLEIKKFEVREKKHPGHLGEQQFIQHLIGYASLKIDPPEWMLKNYYCPAIRAERIVLDAFPYCKIVKPKVEEPKPKGILSKILGKS